jgi:hypothetical protein
VVTGLSGSWPSVLRLGASLLAAGFFLARNARALGVRVLEAVDFLVGHGVVQSSSVRPPTRSNSPVLLVTSANAQGLCVGGNPQVVGADDPAGFSSSPRIAP